MKIGEAFFILKNINGTLYSESEKLMAIKIVLEADTINSITKEELRTAFRWLFERAVEEVKE